MDMRRTRSTAALAALSVVLSAGSVVAASSASADPTALYPLTAGSLGNYSYDVQIGPGVGYDNGPALCTRVVMTHVTLPEADPIESCRDMTSDKLVGDRRVLKIEGHFSAVGSDPIFGVDMYGTTPKAQRLRIKVSGRKALTLKRSSSKILRIDGERVRFFYVATVQADPRKADSVKAQLKKCGKVKGKSRKKCSWKTVADQDYFLL